MLIGIANFLEYLLKNRIKSKANKIMIDDFNLVNANHFIKYINSKILVHIYVECPENYNKTSLITIPNLEGRTLPKKYGSNQCIYYISDPNTPKMKLNIGHSYIFSRNWHNLDKWSANINPTILKIAYLQTDKSIWDSFVLARLITLYKNSARGMYGRNTTVSWKFKENYAKGVVKPIEYILEDPFTKEEYLVWKPYISNKVFEELNQQSIIDW